VFAVVMLIIVRDVPPQASGQASGRVILAFYAGLMVSPLPFGWSVERLLRLLAALGCEVDIVIRRAGEPGAGETIRVHPAAA
jgi:hypothetical protein